MAKNNDDRDRAAERYDALLRGEIDVEEYVKSLRREARTSYRSTLRGSRSGRATRETRAAG